MTSPATPHREPGSRVPETVADQFDRYHRAFSDAFRQLDELRAHVEDHGLDLCHCDHKPRTEPRR